MRLIDADKIKLPQGFFEKVDNVPKFYKWLDKQLTVDAEPVRYGKWLDADDGIGCTCSICGYDAWADTPFCPNCGAKMDEVE